MAKKKTDDNEGYRKLTDTIKAGHIGSFYIFHGDERYLLEHSIGMIRNIICPDGLDGFNYKRFEGKNILPDDLDDAINTLPVFAERTLVEIHDFDLFSNPDKQRLIELFSDLPDYICVLIVYNTIAYKPDGRQKADKALLSKAQVVEFTVQEQSMLIKWITRHFTDAEKKISPDDAGYLAHMTGGLMTALQGEIEKVSAYAAADRITRADIDAVVVPELDAATYKMTDALVRREHSAAMRILDELLRMREPPHILLFSISQKMRQFLAARVCIENKLSIKEFIDISGVKYEFQARLLMETARKTTLSGCRAAVFQCADTAFALNSEPEPEARLTELIVKLAYIL